MRLGAINLSLLRFPSRRLLADSFRIKIVAKANVVKNQRGGVDEAVDAVEDAAVAGDGRAHVLHAEVALDDADGEVAELAADADDEAEDDQIERVQLREGEGDRPRKRQ